FRENLQDPERRYGEIEILELRHAGEDDADSLARFVEERSSGVAGIQGGVDLHCVSDLQDLAPDCAHYAGGHRIFEPGRGAYREYLLAGEKVRAVGKREYVVGNGVYFYDREIEKPVVTDYLRPDPLFRGVGRPDRHVRIAFVLRIDLARYDVIIGERV